MERIDSDTELREAFSEGKMLGVLLVIAPSPSDSRTESSHDTSSSAIPGLTRNLPASGKPGYLAAFSGAVSGKSMIEGFVPPIFDLLDPSGHFKIRESEITSINKKIHDLEKSPLLTDLKKKLSDAEDNKQNDINFMKARMAISKRERDEIRCELSDSSRMAELIRESQFEKAELKRLKQDWEERISSLKAEISSIEDEIKSLKHLRSRMSDELQEWIFRQYIVHDSSGNEASIHEIFASHGSVPPGGTGDCAAPKLLEYAFRNGLKPVAMGEFWYGKSPDTAVRTHGHFYPSCTSKCGPLLGWMMKGMDAADGIGTELPAGNTAELQTSEATIFNELLKIGVNDGLEPEIIYEDSVLIAVNKPSGMPSVPGLDGRESAFEIMKKSHAPLFVVHRLDMDTSGILLFAKTAEAAVNIQKQFENHTVRKTYLARLTNASSNLEGQTGRAGLHNETKTLKPGDKGRIELPLSPDYDERPRQKVDFKHGKQAVTDYEVISANNDGTIDILFHPLTGRTHQLRVHAAHTLGLARPILGDPLYGSASVGNSPGQTSSPNRNNLEDCSIPPHNVLRLHLRAAAITFLHPVTTQEISITLP